MKFKKINILTAIALGAVVAFTGCKKDDGPIPKRVSIEEVPAITTNLASGKTVDTIFFANQATYTATFKVDLYFAGAKPPDKVDVVVRKNGNLANLKVYKATVTTLPASFTITSAEIAALFGTAHVTKDSYDFAPDLYVGTKKYEAFPAVGLGTAQGIQGMSTIGYGEFVRFYVK
jgi:hypothetical protein